MSTRPASAPLLIACALGIEQLALRTGERGGAGGPVTVLRTGMGPKAAERSVTRRLADPLLDGAAVLATGFCAGLAPGCTPAIWWSPRRPGIRTEPFRVWRPTYSSRSSYGPYRDAPCIPVRSPAPIMSSAVTSGRICSRPGRSRSTWSPRPRS